MKEFILVFAALMCGSAWAYKDGTYSCRNSNPDLPNNSYTISTAEIGGVSLPVVQVTRHYNVGGEPREAHLKGVAEISDGSGAEVISLGGIRLEFVNDKIQNCLE